MGFLAIYIQALIVILIIMTILWLISVIIKNVSIVDLFWGIGFVITAVFYFLRTDGFAVRKIILLSLVAIWGLRLSVYLAWRNLGNGEDFRYREFRKKYGEKKYWWISFFQTFLLQGILMWLISAPLLGAQFYSFKNSLGILDYFAFVLWIIGITFEAGGDFQLAVFRANPSNKGKVLDYGFWKYTRHPNYFGDATVWWSYGLFCLASGSYLPVTGSILMTSLIIKISGVALLEKSLTDKKPEYRDYIEKTSPFIPWFQKKSSPPSIN
jgi:steroid 5-alpha reductase family enzyme